VIGRAFNREDDVMKADKEHEMIMPYNLLSGLVVRASTLRLAAWGFNRRFSSTKDQNLTLKTITEQEIEPV
jgi:hypothetical protein